MTLLIGLEIGQKREPTGLCVAEMDRHGSDRATALHYLMRHLERLPPGPSYLRTGAWSR